MSGIFSGIKVIELASVLAGPSVGQFLAELGAEVIKIESPKTGGDVTRSWKLSDEIADDISAYFSSINWGKKSVAIDISTQEGKDILYRLVGQVDIVIASYKPGDAEKLGVDYQSLKGIKPDIIYGKITGYGDFVNKVGYDAIIQAEAGFMDLNGDWDGLPTKMPVALMDILAGHQLKEAILMAYINKLQSGEGMEVSVSLIEAAVASLANQATNWLVAGRIPKRRGSAHPNIAPYGDIFVTKDNKMIILAVGTDRQFENLCKCLNINIYEDAKYSINTSRVKNREELKRILSTAISDTESEYLLTALNQVNVPIGLVQNVKEALAMPEVASMFLDADKKGVATFAAHTEKSLRDSHISPPPKYGQDTQQVLQVYLQISEDEVARLVDKGVLAISRSVN